MLHGWENFYIVAGSSAATLIGLRFVAITLGDGISTPRSTFGASAFLTPTLINFGTVLFQCRFLLAPWSSAWPIGIILGLWGLAALVYQVFVILMQRRIDLASPDWLDWTLFSIAPALGNASMTLACGQYRLPTVRTGWQVSA